jgi:hypothetical protein
MDAIGSRTPMDWGFKPSREFGAASRLAGLALHDALHDDDVDRRRRSLRIRISPSPPVAKAARVALVTDP